MVTYYISFKHRTEKINGNNKYAVERYCSNRRDLTLRSEEIQREVAALAATKYPVSEWMVDGVEAV